jgi:hypothetical protein
VGFERDLRVSAIRYQRAGNEEELPSGFALRVAVDGHQISAIKKRRRAAFGG